MADQLFVPQTKEGLWGVPVIGDLLKAIYNPDLDRAKKQVLIESEAFQKALDEVKNNYPSLNRSLKDLGMLNANGTPNTEKFLDKKYLSDLRSRSSEAGSKAAGALARNQRANAATRGVKGSNTGLASALNKTARGLARDYGTSRKAEGESAYNKGMDFAEQKQRDTAGQQKATIDAQGNRLDTADKFLSAQGKGLLQDPEQMMALAGMIINPGAAIASKGVAGLIGNAIAGGKTKSSTGKSIASGMNKTQQNLVNSRAEKYGKKYRRNIAVNALTTAGSSKENAENQVNRVGADPIYKSSLRKTKGDRDWWSGYAERMKRASGGRVK